MSGPPQASGKLRPHVTSTRLRAPELRPQRPDCHQADSKRYDSSQQHHQSSEHGNPGSGSIYNRPYDFICSIALANTQWRGPDTTPSSTSTMRYCLPARHSPPAPELQINQLEKLLHRPHAPSPISTASVANVFRFANRATSVTPISRKTSNSTRPTSTTRRRAPASPPRAAFPRRPLRQAPVHRSASSGPCRSTHSSSMSTPRLSCHAAGPRCSPAPTSSTCSRATPTCTGPSGSPRRSS